jgi:hypothetical protein
MLMLWRLLWLNACMLATAHRTARPYPLLGPLLRYPAPLPAARCTAESVVSSRRAVRVRFPAPRPPNLWLFGSLVLYPIGPSLALSAQALF